MDRVEEFLTDGANDGVIDLSDEVLPDGDLEITAGFNWTPILWFVGLLGVGWLLWNYLLKPEPKDKEE